jgi:TatA/E family protein of Tat protein translocase
MGALQPFHLVVILIVVLIVFGPGKLTGVGGQLGRGLREFKQMSEGATGAASEERHCTQCGARVGADAAFCPACGNALGPRPSV